jgi:transglutaminase-like putative cysteine protease
MIGCFRSLGLPARYVSGYLETRPPPGKPTADGCRRLARLGAGLVSRNWGWIDLDPTNDVAPSERHVTVAVGRDFGDVTPLKGLLLGGGGQKVRVSVDVEPLG